MKMYVITVMLVFAIDLVAKVYLVYKREAHRPTGATAIDCVIAAGLLAWGAYVLGSGL